MTESTFTIREERVLFQPAEENTRDEWTEFKTIAQRVMIGRKMMGDEEAQATPIYVLKMDTGDRIGETNVTVRIRRQRSEDDMEEFLEVDSVTGTVAGQPAVLDENVIGGVSLRIGNQIIDATLSTRLDEIRDAIAGSA